MSQTLAPRAGRRRAILCVCGASALYVVAAAMVKAIAGGMPTIEIALFRSLSASLLLFPVLWRNGGISALRTHRPVGHVIRVIAGFSSMVTLYYGYVTLPLATVTALSFAMPLVLSVLSVPLLGERVGPLRAAAIVVGLAGVLIMLRPWQEFTGNAAALPMVPVLVVLAGVLGWAVSMISIRQMGAQGERSVTIVLWFSIGCTVLAAALSIPVWVTPPVLTLLWVVLIGAVSTVAQLVMTEGYRAADSALLAPFEYGAIIYTSVLGAVIWGEIPDVWSLLGIAVLVGSGMVVWRSA